MKKVAFLTMDNLDEFKCYDSLLELPMKDLGWETCEISWRDKQVDWNDFDAVIIRSPWDYQDASEDFLLALESIENSDALLANSLALVKWNINKNYLADLENNSIFIVPTLWRNHYSELILSEAFNLFKTDKLIIKPCISANADDTYRINLNDQTTDHTLLGKLFENREFMLQPFMPSIVEEGEFSLFFFDGQYSHSILKKPKSNDFRVQEDHGGQLISITPEDTLLSTANKALKAIPYLPLYARLDFVRHGNSFALMEAELIEPSLYFNMDADSPARFARAFVEYIDVHSTQGS